MFNQKMPNDDKKDTNKIRFHVPIFYQVNKDNKAHLILHFYQQLF